MSEYPKEIKEQLEHMDRMKDTFFRHKKKLVEELCSKLPYNITPTKYYMLKFIYEKEKCMVVDVSKKLELSSGATTITLNQLEKYNLIERRRDSRDRRIVWLTLSEQGKELVRNALKKRDEFWGKMLAVLTEDETKEYFRILEKIENGIERNLDGIKR
ncbi:MarR family winged helix-turn-helix transcriptional regulator [Priestia endophytica]|uniref:MarR family winged helix-turn-helix transcriptional regulator n=1 Tax=Priestia endophytica TaxID=135735 RepID=UPI000F51CFDF|nr:MarR family transcriptional regulator [Priestia endophytica]RPK14870.1 hypothetical protein FH5_00305 [Priestia endophytica]